MAKKNKKKQPQTKSLTTAKFSVGTQVRVRPGTTIPDFPDIPLGGWAGTIQEVDQRSEPPTYLIVWNQYTLEHMHPVYRNRCERDGLGVESMYLGENDLDLDTGEPAVMETPQTLITRPLQLDDEDDRIRAILGLTSDDPLPDVDSDTLQEYHKYLSAHLTFPFPATYSQETGPMRDTTYTITVQGLLDADDCDEFYGLLCEARSGKRQLEIPLGEVEVKKGNPNQQLLADYRYWFWNYR